MKRILVTRKLLEENNKRIASNFKENIFRDVESRKDYLELAQQSDVPVRCFLMNTSHDQAR